MDQIKNYGYLRPKIDTEHWIYGASPLDSTPDLLPSMNWLPYVVNYEPQTLPNGEEDYGCSVWGGQNQIEILLKFLTGIEHNFDERYSYNLIGINPKDGGADPQKFYECTRDDGLTEGVLTLPRTLSEFLTPRPIPESVKEKGRQWEYKLNHAWLWANNPNKEQRIALLNAGLKKSPIDVSVTAWMKDVNGLYIDNGQSNCHWCVCLYLEEKMVDGKMQFCPVVFDSYDQSIKTLHPDHHIEVAKMISLTKKEVGEEPKWYMLVLNWIKIQLGIIQKEIDELPKKPIVLPSIPEIKPKYLWDTVENAKHSVRVICDEEGLNVEEKNTMCATVGGESGWQSYYLYGPNKGKPVIHENYVMKPSAQRQGTITYSKILFSTDRGIAQWNDYYHGKEITADEAQNNPEKSIRLMCKYWKAGSRDTWIAYKNKSYLKYM